VAVKLNDPFSQVHTHSDNQRSVMSHTLSFAGHVILVTGSSRGLGLAFAQCLASHGAEVVINDSRKSERGQATLSAIESAGGSGI
jgi:NADP-dependent 3-hydroxy acid dehydrogenase YdfG